MNKTTDARQQERQKRQPINLLYVFLAFLMVVVLSSQLMPTNTSHASPNDRALVQSKSSPTATPTSTSTRTPTVTQTPTVSISSSSIIQVSAHGMYLRYGPGLEFSVVRRLDHGEELVLLGKSTDEKWLFIRASDGKEGWTHVSWVDLKGAVLDKNLPVQTPTPAPAPTIFVAYNNIKLRTGPGNHFSSIQTLSYLDEILLLGRTIENTWLFVRTSDGQEGWINVKNVNLARVNLDHVDYPIKTSPPTETSTPVILTDIDGRWIDMDLSEQMMRVYEGTTLLDSFLVSTGISIYPTEVGRYWVYAKFPKYTMTGSDYFLPDVPYTMFYSGDFAIHGTYWHHNFGTPMSHGCINMDTKEAEWLYNWADIGTIVNIHY